MRSKYFSLGDKRFRMDAPEPPEREGVTVTVNIGLFSAKAKLSKTMTLMIRDALNFRYDGAYEQRPDEIRPNFPSVVAHDNRRRGLEPQAPSLRRLFLWFMLGATVPAAIIFAIIEACSK